MSTQTELRRLAKRWRAAQHAEREAMSALVAAIAAAALQGMTEAEIVRATAVNRVTVRKAMGKDKGRRVVEALSA